MPSSLDRGRGRAALCFGPAWRREGRSVALSGEPRIEAAILAAGYAPAVRFIHTGQPQSFVYDVADIFKFDTVVPVAFRIAATIPSDPERAVRVACRDSFRQARLLNRIIPTIEEVLAAGELSVPKPPEESVEPAIPNKEGVGDAGHRG